MCLLTIKRLCNWSVPNKTSILAYCTHHELWNNTPVSMFNASVWLYLKPNAAESQRPCWMAGTWNQLRGRGKPARFHLCLSKGYTTNQAPGKRAPLSSVKHRKKEAGTSLLNHIKLHWSQQVTRKDNLTKGFFFSPSFKPFKLFKWNLITNKQLSCPFWRNNPDTCAILHTQKCQPDTAFFC